MPGEPPGASAGFFAVAPRLIGLQMPLEVGTSPQKPQFLLCCCQIWPKSDQISYQSLGGAPLGLLGRGQGAGAAVPVPGVLSAAPLPRLLNHSPLITDSKLINQGDLPPAVAPRLCPPRGQILPHLVGVLPAPSAPPQQQGQELLNTSQVSGAASPRCYIPAPRCFPSCSALGAGLG